MISVKASVWTVLGGSVPDWCYAVDANTVRQAVGYALMLEGARL